MRVQVPPSAPHIMNIFIRYGELVLKLGNRDVFEAKLEKNIKLAMKELRFDVVRYYGHMMLEVGDKNGELAIEKLKCIPGISNFSVIKEVLKLKYPKTPDQKWVKFVMNEIVKIMISEIKLRSKNKNMPKTFCVRVKRIQKNFPMDSVDMEAKFGELILDKFPKLKVRFDNPDITCHLILSDNRAYIYFDKILGLGGLPVTTSGRVISMISSGIDSPVAAFRMMKRGAKVIFVHFHSYPHTNASSQENVKEIVKILSKYQAGSNLNLVPFIEIQKAIMMVADPDLRVVLYRWFMVKIAQEIADDQNAKAIITGESLGQVASQTLDNIFVIDSASKIPILRPLIGSDKQEIVDEAKKIGTFEISTRPYADCCTLFVPKHPSVSANLEKVEAVAKKPAFRKFIKNALKNMESILIESAV
ncbi:TPA: tRNA 4-thiouridine(8) synthase ThiI [Candidatus Peregrinibacteria bacterium]|nr:tRNA 4-thiouridine(8) synthase ThiI [Candidatus Peregrinibacteria bacterium]